MLLICRGCTTAYSVGAPGCPQCGSTKSVEEGSKQHLAMLATRPAPADEASTEDTGAGVPDA